MPISERQTQARARRWLNEVSRNLSSRGLEHARLSLRLEGQAWAADWSAAGAAAPALVVSFAGEIQDTDTSARQQLRPGEDGLPRLLVGLPLSRGDLRATLVLMLPASAQAEVAVVAAYAHSASAWLRLWLAELPETRATGAFCGELAQQLPLTLDVDTLPAVLQRCAQHWQQAVLGLVWRTATGDLACVCSEPQRLPGLRDSMLLCWDSLAPGWPGHSAAVWPAIPTQTQPTQALQQLAAQAGQAACSAWISGRAGQPSAALLSLGDGPLPQPEEAEWVLLALSQGLAMPAQHRARRPVLPRGRKPLAWVAGAALALLALAWPWPHRLHEAGRLAGSTERVVVSTQAGYLAEVRVRPGDAVKAGQVVARLDDQSLRQELARWEAELSRHETRYLQAMSQREVTEAAAVQGELQEARAQAELARLHLAQASLQAPIDGVVVSGDLDRSVGTPVTEGETLMRIAPPGSYRVLFDVDEDEARLLHAGQTGELRPSATPGERHPLQVSRVAPLARVVEGRNRVEVEARIPGVAPALKPGQGVAVVIELEHRSGAWLLWDGVRREARRLWWRSGVGG